jgi:hypothetical protein
MSRLRSAPLKIQFEKGYQAFRRGFIKNPYQRKDDITEPGMGTWI